LLEAGGAALVSIAGSGALAQDSPARSVCHGCSLGYHSHRAGCLNRANDWQQVLREPISLHLERLPSNRAGSCYVRPVAQRCAPLMA
jgi:hypothetical protein